jgi:hypothetical protein
MVLGISVLYMYLFLAFVLYPSTIYIQFSDYINTVKNDFLNTNGPCVTYN